MMAQFYITVLVLLLTIGEGSESSFHHLLHSAFLNSPFISPVGSSPSLHLSLSPPLRRSLTARC